MSDKEHIGDLFNQHRDNVNFGVNKILGLGMMNKFTDEDLAQAKLYAELKNRTPVNMLGLITRLEAAEKALQSAYGFVDVDRKEMRAHGLYEAWLQSCGREAR